MYTSLKKIFYPLILASFLGCGSDNEDYDDMPASGYFVPRPAESKPVNMRLPKEKGMAYTLADLDQDGFPELYSLKIETGEVFPHALFLENPSQAVRGRRPIAKVDFPGAESISFTRCDQNESLDLLVSRITSDRFIQTLCLLNAHFPE